MFFGGLDFQVKKILLMLVPLIRESPIEFSALIGEFTLMYLNEGFLGREMKLQISRRRGEVESAGAGDK